MTKKNIGILIIAYDWPPRSSIAVHRPYAWAKYWSEMGHNVFVVTPKKQIFDEPLDLNLPRLEGVSVVEAEYTSSISQISSWPFLKKYSGNIVDALKILIRPIFNKLGFRRDARDGWIKNGTEAALKIISENQIELMISTFGPRSCHLIASKVKQKDTFWVADYRDQWSENHATLYSELAREKERVLEKSTVSSADLISAVSFGQAEILKKLFEKKDVEIVMNGHDEDVRLVEDRLNNIKFKNSEPIEIVYTGILDPILRNPKPLLIAIKQMIEEKSIDLNEIRVKFYGARQEFLKEMIDELKLHEIIETHGYVSRERSLDVQKNASLLLILESASANNKGVLTGKVFEYMTSGVPILSIGSLFDSELSKLISHANAGFTCENDIEKIKKVISDVKNKNINYWQPNVDYIVSLSRERQSVNFIEAIRRRIKDSHEEIDK